MTDIIADGPRRSDIYPLFEKETPAHRAIEEYLGYLDGASMARRRELGQFFTPLSVARFMGRLAAEVISSEEVHAVEPGAGTGVLAAALCESLPASVRRVHVDAYEVDLDLAERCESTLRFTAEWLADRGTECTFTVHRSDFVLEMAKVLEGSNTATRYDVAISNPPYFKLQKQDERALAAASVVHGQPNIYAIFMAIMARLLREGGGMVTITPRSFASGDYFKKFRQSFFTAVTPDAMHLFGSRREAFRADAVLQENVIIRARRASPKRAARVAISSSEGTSDLEQIQSRVVPLKNVVDLKTHELTLHIPMDGVDDEVVRLVRQWPATLQTHGLKVSTGPVVAFRATQFLRESRSREAAPLLWLQHVRRMHVNWPLPVNKPQYITDSEASEYLLVPNRTYVVMRRFSAKEERRRLVAAPILGQELPGRRLGFENHLNYIYGPDRAIVDHEAIGLAALLNSALIDRYVRISNGNTQVSAAELRRLPLPEAEQIEKIGHAVASGTDVDLDAAIAEVLSVPVKLRRQLDAES